MNGSAFRAFRTQLGLEVGQLADHLDVDPRTVRRWETGTSPVPEKAADAMRDMLDAMFTLRDDVIKDHRRETATTIAITEDRQAVEATGMPLEIYHAALGMAAAELATRGADVNLAIGDD